MTAADPTRVVKYIVVAVVIAVFTEAPEIAECISEKHAGDPIELGGVRKLNKIGNVRRIASRERPRGITDDRAVGIRIARFVENARRNLPGYAAHPLMARRVSGSTPDARDSALRPKKAERLLRRDVVVNEAAHH